MWKISIAIVLMVAISWTALVSAKPEVPVIGAANTTTVAPAGEIAKTTKEAVAGAAITAAKLGRAITTAKRTIITKAGGVVATTRNVDTTTKASLPETTKKGDGGVTTKASVGTTDSGSISPITTDNGGEITGSPAGTPGNPGGTTGNPSEITGSPAGTTGNPCGTTGSPADTSGNPDGTTGNPSAPTDLQSTCSGFTTVQWNYFYEGICFAAHGGPIDSTMTYFEAKNACNDIPRIVGHFAVFPTDFNILFPYMPYVFPVATDFRLFFSLERHGAIDKNDPDKYWFWVLPDGSRTKLEPGFWISGQPDESTTNGTKNFGVFMRRGANFGLGNHDSSPTNGYICQYDPNNAVQSSTPASTTKTTSTTTTTTTLTTTTTTTTASVIGLAVSDILLAIWCILLAIWWIVLILSRNGRCHCCGNVNGTLT